MYFSPGLQELVASAGRVAINWHRGGRTEILLIGDVNDDGELDSTPVDDPDGGVYTLVKEIVDGDSNITRLHLTLTPPNNVDGSAHAGSAKPMLVMH